VPVLREKFADGYVALFCRHRLGRYGAALWLFTCFADVRHVCVFFHFAGLYRGRVPMLIPWHRPVGV